MAHDVFISYSKHDTAIADRVCGALERHDLRCWMAPRDVVAGRNWGESIVQAIGSSRVFVLVFSSHSNDSPQVLREIERAVARNVPLVPYRVDAVEPSPALEYYLSVTHWLNALGPDVDAHLESLVRTVRQIIGPVAPPPAPTARTTASEAVRRPDSREGAPPAAEAVAVVDATPAPSPRHVPAAREIPEPREIPVPREISPPRDIPPSRDLPRPAPDERKTFELAGVWSLVDRFGGLCWLMLAAALPALLGQSARDWLGFLPWYITLLGMVCPAIAAIAPAIPLRHPAIRHVPTVFGVASVLAPIFGLYAIRAGIEASGSVTVGAVSLGLSYVVMTLPFLAAGLFAVGATRLPKTPAAVHARTRVALLTASALLVLLAVRNITGFQEIAETGSKDWPWLGAWLVRLATPSGIAGVN